MDSGRHDATDKTHGSGTGDTSVEPLARFDARLNDAPGGIGLGQVLALYGCGVLVLGVVMLVMSPVLGFAFVLEIISPSAGFLTTLILIGAGIGGIGAGITLLWALFQKEAGVNVGQWTVTGGAGIGLACLAIIVWALAHPA